MHIVRALNTRMQSNARMMRLSRRKVCASSGVGARRLIFRGGARDFRGVKDAVRFIVAYFKHLEVLNFLETSTEKAGS